MSNINELMRIITHCNKLANLSSDRKINTDIIIQTHGDIITIKVLNHFFTESKDEFGNSKNKFEAISLDEAAKQILKDSSFVKMIEFCKDKTTDIKNVIIKYESIIDSIKDTEKFIGNINNE